METLCDLEEDGNEELQMTLLKEMKSRDHRWNHFQNSFCMSKRAQWESRVTKNIEIDYLPSFYTYCCLWVLVAASVFPLFSLAIVMSEYAHQCSRVQSPPKLLPTSITAEPTDKNLLSLPFSTSMVMT